LYDEEAAVQYVLQWANDRNPEYDIRRIPLTKWRIPWPLRMIAWNDCANFASQVLHAGGIEMRDDWYFNQSYNLKGTANDYSQNWTVASKLADWLRATDGILESESHIKAGETALGTRIGDLIGWVNDEGNVYHFGVVTSVDEDGNIYYSGHTRERKNYLLTGGAFVIIFHIDPDAI
jgi:hypothetical protein